MKPIVIIAIAVVCSMVGVFAMLVVIDSYNQLEYEKAMNRIENDLYKQQQLQISEQKQREQDAITQQKNQDNWIQSWRNDCKEKHIGQLEEYNDCIKNAESILP